MRLPASRPSTSSIKVRQYLMLLLLFLIIVIILIFISLLMHAPTPSVSCGTSTTLRDICGSGRRQNSEQIKKKDRATERQNDRTTGRQKHRKVDDCRLDDSSEPKSTSRQPPLNLSGVHGWALSRSCSRRCFALVICSTQVFVFVA